MTINDFKTTGKSLKDFSDSVEYWNYWLQAAIYDKLVREFLANFINDETQVSFNFIVFDRYDQLYSFPVTGITFNDWKERCSSTLMQANYHYVEKEFNLPYAFAKGNIKL